MSYQPPQPQSYKPPEIHTSTPPVTSLNSFTEQGLSELKQHLAAEPVDAKRIQGSTGAALTGQVGSTGSITAGTGFTVNHSGTGLYTVTFTTAYSSAPTLALTAIYGANQRVINLVNLSTASFDVSLRNDAGTLADAAFHFVAYETA